MPRLTTLTAITLLAVAGSVAAQDESPIKARTTEYDIRSELVEDHESVTKHSAMIAGQQIRYTAKAGNMVLRAEDGAPLGSVFYVAYFRDDVEDAAARPITFSFNGGPGSAAVWVHLGALGPIKTELDPEGFAAHPLPGKLVDNPHSVLDVSDLVFIDPVSTGYSRSTPGVDPREFHGFKNDVESVGEFIRLFLTRSGRWSSPKFLAGESYGTTRSAGIASYLQDRYGAYFNGIALISSVLNWQTILPNEGNDLPYIMFLPTYTATAWYHGMLPERLSGDLRTALDEAERFARGDYTTALMMGSDLKGEARTAMAARIAEMTGLSADYVERANLRIHPFRYFRELRRDERLTIGRLDSRYTGRARDAVGDDFEYDPSGTIVDAYFVSLLNHYLRQDLKVESDLPFRQSAGEVWPWNYHGETWRETSTNRFLDLAEPLREAMNKNPSLKVLVQSGYYDLATPYFASDYTVDHMALEPEIAENIWVRYYEAGHMMYVREEDHRKFREDFLELVERALAD
jgi:carboxypeptidase C (cathepsin A)